MAIFFMLFSFLLVSALIYTAGDSLGIKSVISYFLSIGRNVSKNYLQRRVGDSLTISLFLGWKNVGTEIDWGPASNLVLPFKFQFGTCTKIRIANQRCLEKFDNYKI